MTDDEVIAASVARTQNVLLEFLQGDNNGCRETAQSLISSLSDQKVISAFRRRHGLQVWETFGNERSVHAKSHLEQDAMAVP